MTIDKFADCPALLTIRVISGKWKTRILWSLRKGPRRFSELRRELPEASAKMLTAQLRQLEQAQIIMRSPFKHGAVDAVEYAYSDFGRSLIPALDALGTWGAEHFADYSSARPSRS